MVNNILSNQVFIEQKEKPQLGLGIFCSMLCIQLTKKMFNTCTYVNADIAIFDKSLNIQLIDLLTKFTCSVAT